MPLSVFPKITLEEWAKLSVQVCSPSALKGEAPVRTRRFIEANRKAGSPFYH